MIGFDIVISRMVQDEDIKEAFGSLVGVTPNHIEVFDDYPTKPLYLSTKILCIKSLLEGDFPLKISVEIFEIHNQIDFELFFHALSKQLDSMLLVDCNPSHPYKMKLFKPTADSTVVELKVWEADENMFCLKRKECDWPN